MNHQSDLLVDLEACAAPVTVQTDRPGASLGFIQLECLQVQHIFPSPLIIH